MRVVIIGAGEVGYHIAKKLSEENHNVCLIDKSLEKIRRINDNLDVQAFLGSGTSPRMLRNVGIDSAELLVAATNSDEANLIACLLAKNLNRHMLKVARVNNREYLKEEALFSKDMLGVDLLINTRAMMVDAVVKLLEVPGASEVIDFADGQVKLISFFITEESPLANKKLSELRSYSANMLIGAILRGHTMLIPSGRDTIKPMDLVYFVMRQSDVENTVSELHTKTLQIKNIIIVGAGETGAAIASTLDNKNYNVKIIDQNGEKCKEMAAAFKRIIVIKGDGTDRDLLREENAGDMDMVIAMTDDEESNVVISILAKDLGAKRTITRVSKLSYMPVVSTIGLDTVINPRMAAVRAILQYIRRGRILSVAPLREEQAEVIEAEALETSDIVNIPLSKVKFPSGVIIGAIVRGKEIIIPRGDTVIYPHDRVIIFALQKFVPKLEDLLTVKMEYF
jgi:trk system potassium uptake protein TrkA